MDDRGDGIATDGADFAINQSAAAGRDRGAGFNEQPVAQDGTPVKPHRVLGGSIPNLAVVAPVAVLEADGLKEIDVAEERQDTLVHGDRGGQVLERPEPQSPNDPVLLRRLVVITNVEIGRPDRARPMR